MFFEQTLFQPIYKLTGNMIVDQSMYFLAEFLILLIPLSLTYTWFQDRRGKEDALFTAYSTVAGVLFTYVMGLFYVHENPSAFYDTLVAYHPENSFPSQHTTAMFSAAFSLLWREKTNFGYLMLTGAVLTGFSRVYIGEHWPIDIFGAVFAGFAGLGIAYLSWHKLEFLWSYLIELGETIENKIWK